MGTNPLVAGWHLSRGMAGIRQRLWRAPAPPTSSHPLVPSKYCNRRKYAWKSYFNTYDFKQPLFFKVKIAHWICMSPYIIMKILNLNELNKYFLTWYKNDSDVQYLLTSLLHNDLAPSPSWQHGHKSWGGSNFFFSARTYSCIKHVFPFCFPASTTSSGSCRTGEAGDHDGTERHHWGTYPHLPCGKNPPCTSPRQASSGPRVGGLAGWRVSDGSMTTTILSERCRGTLKCLERSHCMYWYCHSLSMIPITYWWLRARLWYLHCINNGDTTDLH